MIKALGAGAAVGAVGMLGSLSALHFAWAAGVNWPATDEAELAAVVAGRQELPSWGACLGVAVGLGAAAALVGGVGRTHWAAVLCRAGIATGFLVRAVAGLTGNTWRLVPWTPTPRFVRLDRRYYGPLCLLISAGVAASVPGGLSGTSGKTNRLSGVAMGNHPI